MINRYNPITKKDGKCTANQKAKELILHFIDNADYWEENTYLSDGITDKEKEEINRCMAKQISRVYATLSPEFYGSK